MGSESAREEFTNKLIERTKDDKSKDFFSDDNNTIFECGRFFVSIYIIFDI